MKSISISIYYLGYIEQNELWLLPATWWLRGIKKQRPEKPRSAVGLFFFFQQKKKKMKTLRAKHVSTLGPT